jgi:hypothetical protein
MRTTYRILFGKPEQNRAAGRPWYGLEDDIKMDTG